MKIAVGMWSMGAMLFVPEALSEPVKLKFAYFSSDRTSSYLMAIKPFVEAVNAEGEGLVHIDVYFSGKLGRNPVQQAQLVLDGVADMAFVVPGYVPDLFPDDGLIELPGLFGDEIEAASLTYTELVREGNLRGHDKFFSIGTFVSGAETVHSHVPISSLADVKGKQIRVNNPLEARTMEKLGAIPVEIPINDTASAMSRGEIDGALLPPSDPLIEFGVARIATNHYMLATSNVPLTLLMNRQVFEELTPDAQKVIEKHSSDWIARRFSQGVKAAFLRTTADLRADERRKVVDVSANDAKIANAVFDEVIAEWVAARPERDALLAKAKTIFSRLKDQPD
jgi:TRAP-type C4-dicarboxylate transport system substrate-binding protein